MEWPGDYMSIDATVILLKSAPYSAGPWSGMCGPGYRRAIIGPSFLDTTCIPRTHQHAGLRSLCGAVTYPSGPEPIGIPAIHANHPGACHQQRGPGQGARPWPIRPGTSPELRNHCRLPRPACSVPTNPFVPRCLQPERARRQFPTKPASLSWAGRRGESGVFHCSTHRLTCGSRTRLLTRSLHRTESYGRALVIIWGL